MADDFERIVAEVREKLAALEVPDLPDGLIYSADEEVVEEYSQGFTRAGQALEAIRSPTTRRSEYEHVEGGESAQVHVAVHPVRAQRASFLLVLLAFGLGGDQDRKVVGAFVCTEHAGRGV